MSESMQTGQDAVEVVRNVFKKAGLPVKEQEFDRGVAFFFSLQQPAALGNAQVYTRSEQFAFEIIFAGHVKLADCIKPEARSRVVEYFMRVNWDLTDGSFVINPEDGTAKYNATINFVANGLTAALVRNAILAGMEAVEIYAQGMFDVAEGKLPPNAAVIAACRAKPIRLENSHR